MITTVYVDSLIAEQARYFGEHTSQENGGKVHHLYLLPTEQGDMLIKVSGDKLEDIVGSHAAAMVGEHVAKEGFAEPEQIGKRSIEVLLQKRTYTNRYLPKLSKILSRVKMATEEPVA